MELFDLYDGKGEFLSTGHVRGQALPQGAYHKIVRIIVQHQDGDFLLMQRSAHKESHPLKYELSAGGSVMKGEDFEEGALRELEEETGIQASQLHLLSDMIVKEPSQCLENIYYCITAIDKQAIRLQEGETQAFKWAKLDELITLNGDESSHLIRLTDQMINQMVSIYQQEID